MFSWHLHKLADTEEGGSLLHPVSNFLCQPFDLRGFCSAPTHYRLYSNKDISTSESVSYMENTNTYTNKHILEWLWSVDCSSTLQTSCFSDTVWQELPPLLYKGQVSYQEMLVLAVQCRPQRFIWVAVLEIPNESLLCLLFCTSCRLSNPPLLLQICKGV